MHLRRSSFPHEKSRGKVKVKVFLTSGDLYIILLKNKYIENERKNIRINNLACTLKKNKRNKFWNNGLHKPSGSSTKKFTMEQIGNCPNPAKFAVIPQVGLEDLSQSDTSFPPPAPTPQAHARTTTTQQAHHPAAPDSLTEMTPVLKGQKFGRKKTPPKRGLKWCWLLGCGFIQGVNQESGQRGEAIIRGPHFLKTLAKFLAGLSGCISGRDCNHNRAVASLGP